MKLISYAYRGIPSVGVVVPGGIVDLREKLNVKSMRDLLARDLLQIIPPLLNQQPDLQIDRLTLLPVVTDPAHIYCVGTNYRDHLSEVRGAGVNRPEPTRPPLFTRFPETLVGSGCVLIKPNISDQLDFEAELAVIIGRGGRHIPIANALEHVAGYACFNDGSVRDWQFHTGQVTAGKNFFASGSFGPWMVTADEIPDPGLLNIECRVNGSVVQSSNTARMIFDVSTIVSYVSELVPLQPGDVVATGTPAGVGFSRKPPLFLAVGDRCEVEIERIGILSNFVSTE